MIKVVLLTEGTHVFHITEESLQQAREKWLGEALNIGWQTEKVTQVLEDTRERGKTTQPPSHEFFIPLGYTMFNVQFIRSCRGRYLDTLIPCRSLQELKALLKDIVGDKVQYNVWIFGTKCDLEKAIYQHRGGIL